MTAVSPGEQPQQQPSGHGYRYRELAAGEVVAEGTVIYEFDGRRYICSSNDAAAAGGEGGEAAADASDRPTGRNRGSNHLGRSSCSHSVR